MDRRRLAAIGGTQVRQTHRSGRPVTNWRSMPPNARTPDPIVHDPTWERRARATRLAIADRSRQAVEVIPALGAAESLGGMPFL